MIDIVLKNIYLGEIFENMIIVVRNELQNIVYFIVVIVSLGGWMGLFLGGMVDIV